MSERYRHSHVNHSTTDMFTYIFICYKYTFINIFKMEFGLDFITYYLDFIYYVLFRLIYYFVFLWVLMRMCKHNSTSAEVRGQPVGVSFHDGGPRDWCQVFIHWAISLTSQLLLFFCLFVCFIHFTSLL